MPGVTVDTHAIVWYLAGDPRLSAKACDALDAATAAQEAIHVPSICLVELTYLAEKGRLPVAARDRLIAALDDPATPCTLVPLDRTVADALEFVSRSDVPDLPDRIITATAAALRTPLISRSRLAGSNDLVARFAPSLLFLDNSLMHILQVHVHVKPERIDEFQLATIENASRSVQEPGCVRFDVIQQTDDLTRFVLVETYRDAESHAAHRETPHYHAWIERVTDMLAEPRTRAVYRNIYPADDGF